MGQGWLFSAEKLGLPAGRGPATGARGEPPGEPPREPPPLSGAGKNPVLMGLLEVAVPKWIEEVRKLSPEERFASIKGVGQLIAEKGDVLMFGGGKKGEAAHLFNELARGLAVLSFVPGGVKFAGMKWESTA